MSREHSPYELQLSEVVDDATARRDDLQQRYDACVHQVGYTIERNPWETQLGAAEEALKSAKKRLATYRRLPFTEMVEEISRLKAECEPDRVADGLKPLRELALKAGLARIELFVAIQRYEHATYDKLHTIARMEGELLSASPQTANIRSKAVALTPLTTFADACRDDLLAELRKLQQAPDGSPVAKALRVDGRRQLLVADRDADVALHFAVGNR